MNREFEEGGSGMVVENVAWFIWCIRGLAVCLILLGMYCDHDED